MDTTENTTAPRTRRVTAGLYELAYGGTTYSVERNDGEYPWAPMGAWLVVDKGGDGEDFEPWLVVYGTKADAINDIVAEHAEAATR